MAEVASPSAARPAVVLGLTFLLLGGTFALIPDMQGLFGGRVSPEAANVYAVAAWAGWAHFLYAFRGQGQALARLKKRRPDWQACLWIRRFGCSDRWPGVHSHVNRGWSVQRYCLDLLH